MCHLFVYGTLLPGESRWRILEPMVLGEGVADRVPGMLYDTGEGYPAASFAPTREGEAGARIVGRVFALREDDSPAALAALDEVEGSVAGLYRRVVVTTDGGVVAWAYEYGGGLALVPIVSGSWVARDR